MPRLEGLESRALLSTITEFAGPYDFPVATATGKDGNIWVLNSGYGYQGSLTEVAPDGTPIRTYRTPDMREIGSIAVASDGRVWFTQGFPGAIAVLDPTTGAVVAYPLPPGQPYAGGLVAGPGGSIAFTTTPEYDTSIQILSPAGIGRIDADGTMAFTPTPGLSPGSVAFGTDGTLRFLASGGGTSSHSWSIGRIAPDGSIVTTPLPADFTEATDLQVGPDGALWFLDGDLFAAESIGRVAADGSVTEYPLPPGGQSSAGDLIAAPDGNFYYDQGGSLFRMTPAGSFASIPLPATGQFAAGSTIGADGDLWFAASIEFQDHSRVGRLTLDDPSIGWTPLSAPAPISFSAPVGKLAQPSDPTNPHLLATTPVDPTTPIPTPPVATGPTSAAVPAGAIAPTPAPAPSIATVTTGPARPIVVPISSPSDATWLAAPSSLFDPAGEIASPAIVGQAHPGAKAARNVLGLSTAPLIGR